MLIIHTALMSDILFLKRIGKSIGVLVDNDLGISILLIALQFSLCE
jgi:hypothetical protein